MEISKSTRVAQSAKRRNGDFNITGSRPPVAIRHNYTACAVNSPNALNLLLHGRDLHHNGAGNSNEEHISFHFKVACAITTLSVACYHRYV